MALSLILPLAGMFVWLQWKKDAVKREVKASIQAGLQEEELVLLKFGPEELAELEWEDEGEFEFKRQMYDLVRMEQRGDSTFFWCWWDNEESRLEAQLHALIDQILGQDGPRREKQQQLDRYFKSFYYSEKKLGECIPPPKFEGNALPITLQTQWERGPAGPPPRFVCTNPV